MYNFDNYSHEYKTRRIFKLWIKSCYLLGKPTNADLERYPAVHLAAPHQWAPSVLDFTHPSSDGDPPCSNDPNERLSFEPNFDEFRDYTQRAIQPLNILDDSSLSLTLVQPLGPTNMLLGPTNMLSIMTPLTMKTSGLI